jgi:hypothetical protein
VAGERHIAFGWRISRSGRKTVVGSALATADGQLCALGQALWIDPKGNDQRAHQHLVLRPATRRAYLRGRDERQAEIARFMR